MLMDEKKHARFTAGAAQISRDVGGAFFTNNGYSTGTNRIGVARSNTTWLLDASGNGLWGPGDYQYTFGKAGDRYITGKWS